MRDIFDPDEYHKYKTVTEGISSNDEDIHTDFCDDLDFENDDIDTENWDDLDIDDDDTDTDFDDEVDNDIGYTPIAFASPLRKNHNFTTCSYCPSTKTNEENSDNFQDVLIKNMKTPETVHKENEEREKSSAMWDAKRTMEKIKKLLIYKVQNAEYEKHNEITSVSCTCDIHQYYLKSEWYDNSSQLKQNKETFFLFRDPNLVYKSGYYYDIKSDYRREYNLFISALNELATKEKITIETVLVNKGKVLPFPNRLDSLSGYVQLCIKATTIIKIDPNYTPSTPEAQTQTTKTSDVNSKNTQKNDNATTIAKSLLCVLVCIIAFAICLTGEIGKFGMALVLIGAVILGYFIINK